MFLHFYRDFTEDDDMTEFPYPTKDLTGGEVLCMKDVAKELGLEVEQREQVCHASRQLDLTPPLFREGNTSISAYFIL